MKNNYPFQLVLEASRVFGWEKLEKRDMPRQLSQAKIALIAHAERLFHIPSGEHALPIQLELAAADLCRIMREMAQDEFWRKTTVLSAVNKYIISREKQGMRRVPVDSKGILERMLDGED